MKQPSQMPQKFLKAVSFEKAYGIDISLKSDHFDAASVPVKGLPRKVVVRKMIVDMAELNTELQSKVPNWNELEIYADTLIFPRERPEYSNKFAFKLGGSPGQKVSIYVRAIFLTEEVANFVNYDPNTQMKVYVKEIIGAGNDYGGLMMSSIYRDGGIPRNEFIEMGADAIGFSIVNNECTDLNEQPSSELFKSTSPLYWLLQSCFNVGSALGSYAHAEQLLAIAAAKPKTTGKDTAAIKANAHVELAQKMLSWIHYYAAQGDNMAMQHLALNAASMESYFAQLERKSTFVPALAEGVYEKISKEYLEIAIQAEKNYKDDAAELLTMKQFRQYIQTNLAHFEDKTGMADQLKHQAQLNSEAAEQVWNQNKKRMRNLVRRNGAIDIARGKFEAGFKAYKDKKEKEAIKGIVMAVISVGLTLGELLAGDEAAATGEIAKVEKVAKEVSAARKIVDAVKKFADVIKKMNTIREKLSAAKDAISKLKTAKDLKGKDYGEGIKLPQGEQKEVYDGAYWDTFAINIKLLIQPAIEKKITGAPEYLAKLEMMCLEGKTVYTNQITMTETQQKLLQRELEEKVALEQVQRLKDLQKQGQIDEELVRQAKVTVLQNLLRIKARVIFYTNFRLAALRYWAVMTPADLTIEHIPLLADEVSTLGTKLTGILALHDQVLADFGGAPQIMDELFVIDDPAVIQQLQDTARNAIEKGKNQTCKFSWILPIDHPTFAAKNGKRLYGRMRVSTVRAFLNLGENGESGVKVTELKGKYSVERDPKAIGKVGRHPVIPDPNKKVNVSISTSSHYLDRFRSDKAIAYVSPSFRPKNIKYTVNTWKTPSPDGNVVEGNDTLDFTFFQPTPFTSWTIEILPSEAKLDLSELKYVTLQVIGSLYSI